MSIENFKPVTDRGLRIVFSMGCAVGHLICYRACCPERSHPAASLPTEYWTFLSRKRNNFCEVLTLTWVEYA